MGGLYFVLRRNSKFLLLRQVDLATVVKIICRRSKNVLGCFVQKFANVHTENFSVNALEEVFGGSDVTRGL